MELSEFIVNGMSITLHALEFYTDSRVVLGQIHNQKRWFYVYVINRVDLEVDLAREVALCSDQSQPC